jgi:hypothetical protein
MFVTDNEKLFAALKWVLVSFSCYSTGNPIYNFASNLLLIIPPVLFTMSLLALRKADYDYTFTLLLASIVVTVALSAFQENIST